MNDDEKADLCWDAFRYIAAEMAAEEQARFEERLAVEQNTREAVAVAVEIAHGVVSVPCSQPAARAGRRRKGRWRVRLAWSAAAALAICAAFAGGWMAAESAVETASQPEQPLDVAAPDAAQDFAQATTLVSLWSRAATGESTHGESGDLMAGSSTELPADGLTETGLDVPDWMWAALKADLPAGVSQPDEWEDN